MDRQRFGRWGIGLAEDEFAEALAGAGVSGGGTVRTWSLPSPPESLSDFVSVEQARGAFVKGMRLRIVRTFGLHAAWLTATLSRVAESVYIVRNLPSAPISAERPLRLGFLDEDDALLSKEWQVVRITPMQRRCDLLLLPSDLQDAAKRIADAPFRPECDCVIVTGKSDVDDDRADALLSLLRTEARTSGVAVGGVERSDRSRWLSTLIRELSRNQPIDVALANAAHDTGVAAPVLICSDALLRFTRRDYDGSVSIRGGRPSTAFESFDVSVAPERSVQARITDDDGQPPITIASETAYVVNVRIADANAGWIAADAPFDESRLPPSQIGHEITVALVELRDGTRAPLCAPQQQTIHLPPTGASTEAKFAVRTAAAGAFAARVLVLHEARVLQTLRLRIEIGCAPAELQLNDENLIKAEFDELDERRGFDAAIVINDHDDGTPGVTVSTAKRISFFEPPGFANAVDAISDVLTGMTSLAESDFTLDDPDVRKLLVTLAAQGKLLWDDIAENAPDALGSAARVQVVEARRGAFLPAEFLYTSYAPDVDAEICPHGRDALATATFTPCPNATNRHYVCPAVFWGFSRVIERRPYQELPDRREYQLSEPYGDRRQITPLDRALVGASKRVAAADIDQGVLPAVTAAVRNGVEHVPDWMAWMASIRNSSPTLLLLMPHTDEDEGIARLEIGDQPLRVSTIEEDYVRQHLHEPGPVVMLLGCSTSKTTIRFHNFVSRFQSKGAALVVGTLSTIRGRHATRFVKQFLAELAKWCGQRDATFGDALLAVKRKMLLDGDPFALTVIAYGDADWRL